MFDNCVFGLSRSVISFCCAQLSRIPYNSEQRERFVFFRLLVFLIFSFACPPLFHRIHHDVKTGFKQHSCMSYLGKELTLVVSNKFAYELLDKSYPEAQDRFYGYCHSSRMRIRYSLVHPSPHWPTKIFRRFIFWFSNGLFICADSYRFKRDNRERLKYDEMKNITHSAFKRLETVLWSIQMTGNTISFYGMECWLVKFSDNTCWIHTDVFVT